MSADQPARSRSRHHRFRVGAAALLASGITLLVLLLVGVDALGTPPDPNLGHKVTLCHAEGNGSWHSMTVDVKASGLEGGHDNDGGVHAADIIPPFTWIDNKGDAHAYTGRNLATSFDGVLGSTILANSCTAPDPEPEPDDVCANIDGIQSSVPDGLILDDGNCVEPPAPVDACPNLDGVQDGVPTDHVVDGAGNCVPAGTETDVCPNLPGDQTTVPDGYYLSGRDCVLPNDPGSADPPDDEEAPADVCANLPGDQATVPAGLELEGGACVTATVPGDTDGGGDDHSGGSDTAEQPGATGGTDTSSGDVTEVPEGSRVVGHGELPFTGTDPDRIALLAAVLIALGLALEFAHRRQHAARE